MASLWKFGGLKPKKLAKRVWAEVQQDDVFGRAAQLSYYFLLALFPLLIFLTSVIGIVIGQGSGIRQSLFSYLSQVIPPTAFRPYSIHDAGSYRGEQRRQNIIRYFGSALGTSNGMGAITEALNVAYDVKESRPWETKINRYWFNHHAVGLDYNGLVIVLSGGKIVEGLAANYALGSVFTLTWKILQWPIVLAAMLFAFAMIYYFGPDVRDQKWVWITPGAVLGVMLWLLVSYAFRIYLDYFDSYSKTYGSLGAVIILMLWLYFTGLAVLIGGEVNAEIEHAAAELELPTPRLRVKSKVPAELRPELQNRVRDRT